MASHFLGLIASWNLPFKKWVIWTTLDWISSFPYLGRIFTHISRALLSFSLPAKVFKSFFPTRLHSESLHHLWPFSKGSDFTFFFFLHIYILIFILWIPRGFQGHIVSESNFVRNCQIFPKCYLILHFNQQVWNFQLTYILANTWYCLPF